MTINEIFKTIELDSANIICEWSLSFDENKKLDFAVIWIYYEDKATKVRTFVAGGQYDEKYRILCLGICGEFDDTLVMWNEENIELYCSILKERKEIIEKNYIL